MVIISKNKIFKAIFPLTFFLKRKTSNINKLSELSGGSSHVKKEETNNMKKLYQYIKFI